MEPLGTGAIRTLTVRLVITVSILAFAHIYGVEDPKSDAFSVCFNME